MARKPNYRADRIERERAKATKKAKRLEARTGKSGKPSLEETSAKETSAVDDSTEDSVAEALDGDGKGNANAS
jgi:hypothetical protein